MLLTILLKVNIVLVYEHFNKNPVMTKEDHEDSEDSTKYWIYDKVYVDRDFKVRDHCHITAKYRGSARTV